MKRFTTFCVFCAALALAARAAGWSQEKGYRWKELPARQGAKPGFKLLSPTETGVAFTNTLSELSIASNRVLANGSGIGVGDYDGDGLPDFFACALERPAALYRNLGAWKFQDQTAASGLPTNLLATRAAVFADINNDGHLDLLITTVSNGVRCFLNSGTGTFTETTEAAGLKRASGAMTIALADIDGNGTLDLYVANYRPNDIRDRGRVSFRNVGGKPVPPAEYKDRLFLRDGQVAEYGEPDQLYLNDGKGQFTPVSWTGGAFLDSDGKPLTAPPMDWGLTATFRDINGDGAPDLYVCNDYWTPDRLWLNDGKGHFGATAPFTLRKIPSSSMGVDFADINRDGHLDFFAVEMLSPDPRVRKRQRLADKPVPPAIGINADLPQVFQNTLFLNRGDSTFAEIACFAGLEATDWSWSPLFIDVDLDGFEDLLISAGHFHDVQDLDAELEIRRRQHSWSGYTNDLARQQAYTRELMENYRLYPPLQFPIRAFRNLGNLHFQDAATDWGFTNAAIHHGIVLADFDGDGDLDLVVNSLNAGLEIYRNEAPAPRVAVRLKGPAAIGSKIILHDPTGSQQKEITVGGAYLSGSETLAVFAVNTSASIEVTWRNGKKSTIDHVLPNRIYEIEETQAAPSSPTTAKFTPLFEDVSDRLAHSHHELPFDDYARQPLLPFKLSQQGPAVAWFDFDGDGADDLIIGAGAGASPTIFLSDGKGAFSTLR